MNGSILAKVFIPTSEMVHLMSSAEKAKRTAPPNKDENGEGEGFLAGKGYDPEPKKKRSKTARRKKPAPEIVIDPDRPVREEEVEDVRPRERSHPSGGVMAFWALAVRS